MTWKNWPYWLKGGFVGLFIRLLVLIITFGIIWTYAYKDLIGMLIIAIDAPFYIISRSLVSEEYSSQHLYLALITGTLFYILFGTLIGFIYGKIKKFVK